MKENICINFISSVTILSGSFLFCFNAARAETRTAESGNIFAEFSYDEGELCLSNPELKLVRDGQTFLAKPPSIASFYEACRFSKLQVRDLDGNGEPEVILDLYTGGAHCCWFSQIYRFKSAQNQYVSTEHFWGNGGYNLKDFDRDGHLEFESRDDRFAYAFAPYAASAYPLQIWQYREGEMNDVTRDYPQLVYSDAYRLWQRYAENRNEYREVVRASLAAYLADKYLLGQEEDGWQRVRQAYQASDRNSFFQDLRRFLQKTGYLKASGQTNYFHLAELEKTGLYSQCPQDTGLVAAGETADYRFALCSGELEESYYLGQSKRSGETITVKHQDGDPSHSFRRGEYVYRLRWEEDASADMYLEVFRSDRQLLSQQVQNVYLHP